MPTERQKMLAGEFYNAADAELLQRRRRARDLLRTLNASGDDEQELRQQVFRELFGTVGNQLWIEPPFYCDYGSNISLGDRVYCNFSCVVLDPVSVAIGNDVLWGPNVQLYTATHPLDHRERQSGLEYGKPICIGSNVWLGGGAIVCPGVSIGSRSVIGAGSVVTRDIPAGVFAAGSPCRVIRDLP